MFDGLTTTLFVFAVIFLVSYLLISRLNRKSNGGRQVPPCVPHVPVLGSMPFLLDARTQLLPRYMMNKSKKLGPVFALYAGSTYVVVLNGREAIHEALVTRGSDFAGRWQIFTVLQNDPECKAIAFHQYNSGYKQVKQQMLAILREFGFGRRLMESRILAEVDVVTEHIKALGGKEFNAGQLLGMSAVNVTLNVLFGHRWQYDDVQLQQLIEDMLRSVENLCLEVDMFPLLKLVPAYQRRMEDSVRRLGDIVAFIRRHVDICLQNQSERDNLVCQIAIAKGDSLDRDLLSLELRDIVMGAANTTSTTLQFLLIQLANHDDIQRRLHAEIDSVVGKDRHPLLEDRPGMVLMEAAVLEVLRMYSVVALAIPHETLCDTSVGGFYIPAHTKVLANLYSAHRDPDDWPHPDVFDPDRFIDSHGQLVDKERVIAFSYGKRACLGEQLARQQLFLIAASLLQQFTILPPAWCKRIDDSEAYDSVLVPAVPFTVRLRPRQ